MASVAIRLAFVSESVGWHEAGGSQYRALSFLLLFILSTCRLLCGWGWLPRFYLSHEVVKSLKWADEWRSMGQLLAHTFNHLIHICASLSGSLQIFDSPGVRLGLRIFSWNFPLSSQVGLVAHQQKRNGWIWVFHPKDLFSERKAEE